MARAGVKAASAPEGFSLDTGSSAMPWLNQADRERMAFIQPRAQGCLCDVSVHSLVPQQVSDGAQQKSAVPGLLIVSVHGGH